MRFPSPCVLHFQDKEHVTSCLYFSAGTAHDGFLATGNDRAEYHFAQALNCCTVIAHYGGASLDLLALGSDVLEALAFEFDCIEPDMHNQLNAIAHRDPKGVTPREELDQVPGHWS